MPITLVSLGANLGNSRTTINTAATMLQDSFGFDNVQLSSLIASPAIGGPELQDDFFNAVAKIDTQESVFSVWNRLTLIERNLGRRRRLRWESRQIDLDILMYDNLRLWTPHLKVPHPRMVTRSFAILPAAELLADAIEPVSGFTLSQLGSRLGYIYQPEAQLLTFHSQSVSRSNEVIIVCESDTLMDKLQARAAEMKDHPFVLQFITFSPKANKKEFIDLLNSQITLKTTLLVLAVDCPDPMTIAWEDYSRRYAGWLQLDVNHSSTQADDPKSQDEIELKHIDDKCSAPKYLLNCSDIDWAVHELQAALTAMSCEISFAQPGWNQEIQHD